MNVLKSLAMAFSLFSCVPVPQFEWDKRNMRYMMCFFPLVGVLIGALVWLWCLLCAACSFGSAIRAAGIVLVPIVVSGGIHMDGFADVVDAQSSHAAPERKCEILKDPHTGSFAILGIGCYLLAAFACACEVDAHHLFSLACIPVVSRALSGIATVAFSAPETEGMFAQERTAASPRLTVGVLVAVMVCISAAMVFFDRWVAAVVLVAALAVWFALRPFANSQFGGMNGDLAGFFLQVAELAMLACLVVAGQVV